LANDSGDKTEKATPKKLRDARKKGDIPKSKDLSSTLGLVLSIGVLIMVSIYAAPRFAHLMNLVFTASTDDFNNTLLLLGKEALWLFIICSVFILIPVALFGIIAEFMQVGVLITLDKLKPDLTKLNPVSGFKKMFSADNFFELIKSTIKTSAIFLFGWLTIQFLIPNLVLLPQAEPVSIVGALKELIIFLFASSLAFLLFFTAIDVSYQHYSFAKKMKMSIRDIKQEYKDSEGDPTMKGHRRQIAQEWAQEGASEAAGSANALIVNPTHVAVAIRFDRELEDVPVITAMGEDKVAQAMRDSAKRNNVPVVRNINLARTLLADAEEGGMVPRELFDTVAEVIIWAQAVKERIDHEKEHRFIPWEGECRIAPGEDLTQYPEDSVPPKYSPDNVQHHLQNSVLQNDETKTT